MNPRAIKDLTVRIAWCTLIPFILVCIGCGGGQRSPEYAIAVTDTLRVMAYNIHHAEGMDEVIDLDRIAALIREVDPDVVTLQEVDSVVARTNSVDQALELASLTGYQPVFSQFMPYQGGGYGMAVLSRLPVAESRTLRLPDGEEPRTSLSVTLRSEKGLRYRIVGIHFYMTENQRLAQARKTEELLGDDVLLGNDVLPTILLGDFNSQLGDSVMTHLSQSWTIVEKGVDHFTFPSYAPEKEIDFLLFRPANRFEVINQFLIDEPVISDHRPYVVDLVITQMP